MSRYVVQDANIPDRKVVLLDNFGKRHLAVLTADVPALGEELHGAQPASGFHLLVSERTGQVFRAIFEVVNYCEKASNDRRDFQVPDVAAGQSAEEPLLISNKAHDQTLVHLDHHHRVQPGSSS